MPEGDAKNLTMKELIPGNYYLILRRPKRSIKPYVPGRYKYLGQISKYQRLFMNEETLVPFETDTRWETNEYIIYHVITKPESPELLLKEDILTKKYLHGSNSSVNSRFGGRRRKTLRKTRKRGTRKSIGSPN